MAPTPPHPARAQHWIATGPGGLDTLRLVDVDVPPPGPGEVTIDVRAAGVNPADGKHFARPGAELPVPLGYEVSGVVAVAGPGTAFVPGDEVLAFRVRGGYTTRLTVPVRDVFAKPAALGHPEAANLLLAGTTAAEMLDVTGVRSGDTVLLHGASGAVGVSVLQQARLLGVRVIGTAGAGTADTVTRFGGEPVRYGEGLAGRVRELAPAGVVAALDAVGTDEAVDVSLALVADRDRIVTIAAFDRAGTDGIRAIGGTMPASAAFRDSVRQRLVDLAAAGDLVVPLARTYPLVDAVAALEFLQQGHPGGKLALVP